MSTYIKNVVLNWDKIENPQEYPFKIFYDKGISTLKMKNNVTFFVGDNGTGKSTLLEAMAINYGLNPEGGSKNFNFSTKRTHSELSNKITLSKGVILARDSFFLRAETFYNLATEIENIGGSLYDVYGGDLHAMSHGESFLSLLGSRLYGNGIYLLDEPEAALSPTGQLSLLKIIYDLVEEKESQFIIATHSPILTAYPNATIYEFGEEHVMEVKYENTMNYLVNKRVMNDCSWISQFLDK